tara:strand:- start:379 stop:1383 length:1005 start_codon:yes stop_codon:yes gene_type:complete
MPPPPSMPPPQSPISSNSTNFFSNDNVRNRAFPRRRRNSLNRRINTPRTTTRMGRGRAFQPFFFGNSTTQNILNNSLYDRIPNNPLSTADFLRETTHDTWINIRTLVDLPITSRCVITQEQFNDDDIVSRIYRCGHVFNHNALLRWFERDTRCPICRYNLANSTNNPRQNISTQTNSTNTINSTQNIGATDISNNIPPPVTWRDPIVSPNNSNNIFNSMVNDLEQNITNTIMDNSENIMNLSTQVANSLFGSVSNNLNNTTNLSDFMTTEFSFNIPTLSNSTNINPFNGFNMGCPNNNQSSRNTTEQKTEEKAEEAEEKAEEAEEKTEENDEMD